MVLWARCPGPSVVGAVDALVEDRDVLVVNSPDLVRRQSVPLGAKAGTAIAILSVMVGLLAADLVPPAVAGLGAATAMVPFRVISSRHFGDN